MKVFWLIYSLVITLWKSTVLAYHVYVYKGVKTEKQVICLESKDCLDHMFMTARIHKEHLQHPSPNHCLASTVDDFFYLFGVLRRFQHCTGHITTGSWKGRGNQYIEFARVVYCKLPTNGKQLPAFPLEPVRGSNPGHRGGRRECYHSATVAPHSR